MRLLYPGYALVGLILAGALWGFWWALDRRGRGQLARFAGMKVLESVLLGSDLALLTKVRRRRALLLSMAVFFAGLGLARPQLGTKEEMIPSNGLDLVFVIDVSNSMLAEDTVPNRMKKAKHLIRNFLDRMSGDRVGIVAFAGSSYTAVPLTTDYEYIRQTLELLDETSVTNQGSNLRSALETSMGLLDRGGLNEKDETKSAEDAADAGSQVMILISDGESHVGKESELESPLREKGIRVFAIGVGSEKGSPIPLRDASGYLRGYKKDASGNMVLTKLETKNLESISSKTSGKFYVSSANEGEVDEIVDLLKSLDRVEGAGRRVIVYDEYFQLPLLFAVLAILLAIGVRESRARFSWKPGGARKSATLLLALVLGLLGGGAPYAQAATSLREYSETQKGIDAFEKGDFAAATQHFGSAQAADPDRATHHMNLGDALLKSGAPEAAAKEFEAATSSAKGGSESAKASYNLGKSFEAQKDYEKAIRSYQAGLDRLNRDPNPDFEVKQRLKRALEIAQNQKQNQSQQNDKNKDSENKDQKSDDQKGKSDEGSEKDKKDKGSGQKQVQTSAKKQFQGEKLTESDAKRILQQLQDQEKKTQVRLMRNKTGPKAGKEMEAKDW